MRARALALAAAAALADALTTTEPGVAASACGAFPALRGVVSEAVAAAAAAAAPLERRRVRAGAIGEVGKEKRKKNFSGTGEEVFSSFREGNE